MRWCLVFLLLNCYFSKCVGEEDLSKFEEVIIPSIANQGGSYNALHKIQFLLDNLFQEKTPNASVEYPGYDGWNNNIGNPELGAIDTPLLRRWPAVYEDGVYQISEKNRPNPLTLSEKLFNGDLGDARSRTGKNVLMVFFGQHIVEEIVDAQRPACPPEYINIKIPEGHRYREKPGHTRMPVLSNAHVGGVSSLFLHSSTNLTTDGAAGCLCQKYCRIAKLTMCSLCPGYWAKWIAVLIIVINLIVSKILILNNFC